MAASQRVSRGFHRLALFLAAIPLLLGTILSLGYANNVADQNQKQHAKLVCANKHVLKADKELADNPFWYKAKKMAP